MAERTATILHTVADVAMWRRELLSCRPTRSLPDVHFALDFLSSTENDVNSALAERLKRRCGCEAGGIAGALTLITALMLFAAPLTWPALSWATAGAAVAIVFAVSITAKFFALAWSRLALIRLASELVAADHFDTHSYRGGSYGSRLQ